jgi:hypothetical protein
MTLLPTTNTEVERFTEMSEVIEAYLIDKKNPTQIARESGLRRVDVINHIEEWKRTAVGTDLMKDRVEELIATLDQHYNKLIQKTYEIIEEVDRESELEKSTMTRAQMLSQKLGALKAIADFEAKRIDVLQKSGLLEAADLGDELAAMEEQRDAILTIMEDELCSACKPKVLGRLAALITGNQPVVVVNA